MDSLGFLLKTTSADREPVFWQALGLLLPAGAGGTEGPQGMFWLEPASHELPAGQSVGNHIEGPGQ